MPVPLISLEDPRLLLPVLFADLKDSETQQVISSLSRYAQQNPSEAILSAPTLGMNRRVLSLRQGNDIHILLNPVVIKASDFQFVPNEACLLANILQRSAWRPKEVTLAATWPDGQQNTVALKGDVAHRLMLHMEYLDGRQIFEALTTFERRIARAISPVPFYSSLRSLREGNHIADINGAALVDKLHLSWKNEDLFEIYGPEGEDIRAKKSPIMSVDIRNPYTPQAHRHARMIAMASLLKRESHIQICGLRSVFLPRLIHTYRPDLTVHCVEPNSEVADFYASFDLDDDRLHIHRGSFNDNLYQLPEDRLSCVVIDAIISCEETTALLQEESLRALSKKLMSNGMLLVFAEAATFDVDIINGLLLKIFTSVYKMAGPDGVLLVGSRSQIDQEKLPLAVSSLLNRPLSGIVPEPTYWTLEECLKGA